MLARKSLTVTADGNKDILIVKPTMHNTCKTFVTTPQFHSLNDFTSRFLDVTKLGRNAHTCTN